MFSNLFPTNEVRGVERAGRAIQSDSTHDRDPNGQQLYDGESQQREPMTEEQLEAAMEHLRNLPSVKEHKWTVDVEMKDESRFVVVKDNLGTVIRKIPEWELWTLPDLESPRGQLFKRSA